MRYPILTELDDYSVEEYSMDVMEENSVDEERIRRTIVLPNGRRTIKRAGRKLGLGVVHVTYLNRAFEWVGLKNTIILWL